MSMFSKIGFVYQNTLVLDPINGECQDPKTELLYDIKIFKAFVQP
jgi:hypothetical protein